MVSHRSLACLFQNFRSVIRDRSLSNLYKRGDGQSRAGPRSGFSYSSSLLRLFLFQFGIVAENGEVLRQAILSAAENSDDAELLGNNGHGEVYILRFPVETRRGSATVLTVWIIRDGEDFPRLITCYIL
jgi:Domain of unknown function (DUF6883)